MRDAGLLTQHEATPLNRDVPSIQISLDRYEPQIGKTIYIASDVTELKIELI